MKTGKERDCKNGREKYPAIPASGNPRGGREYRLAIPEKPRQGQVRQGPPPPALSAMNNHRISQQTTNWVNLVRTFGYYRKELSVLVCIVITYVVPGQLDNRLMKGGPTR
jgi:hypothetical protein